MVDSEALLQEEWVLFKLSLSLHLGSRTASTSNSLCDLFAKLFSYVALSFPSVKRVCFTCLNLFSSTEGVT